MKESLLEEDSAIAAQRCWKPEVGLGSLNFFIFHMYYMFIYTYIYIYIYTGLRQATG